MPIESILLFVAVGGLLGLLAARLMRDQTLGVPGNVLVGIVGAFLGVFLFSMGSVAFVGILGMLITATLGAMLLLGVATTFSRRDAH
jgi:uncharacterized membrane protein YeaQ/YmgE (transglycosylase-associated protein family)